MHTLLILNPGHFHAGLVLREAHPRLCEDIYVYAPEGPDLKRLQDLAESFNRRALRPTRWRLHIRTGTDPLNRLIEERKGDIVVLAGKNHDRMELIDHLTRSGFYVLADKPWVISETALPHLLAATESGRPIAVDIMTERYEITTLLQKRLIAEKGVFGQVRIEPDGSPSVYKESVHHLCKQVNRKPLVRPIWYFDTRIQGDGVVDVTTHLVDMTHWMLFPGVPIHFDPDIDLQDARCWPTAVPLEAFRKITLADRFPDALGDRVKNKVLQLFCNGDIRYRVKRVPVHIRVVWNLETPEGGGDTHCSFIRGTRSDLLIRQLPERGFRTELLVVPREDVSTIQFTLQRCLDRWSDELPGLSISRERGNLLVNIPDTLRTTHEEHFCQVRGLFLDWIDAGTVPSETRPCLVSKYTLLANAGRKAGKSPAEPMPAPSTH